MGDIEVHEQGLGVVRTILQDFFSLGNRGGVSRSRLAFGGKIWFMNRVLILPTLLLCVAGCTVNNQPNSNLVTAPTPPPAAQPTPQPVAAIQPLSVGPAVPPPVGAEAVGTEAKAPPVTTAAACFVPGLYQLTFDPQSKWVNADDYDKDNEYCNKVAKLGLSFYVKLKSDGAGISITQHSTYEPLEENVASGDGSLTRTGDCQIAIKIREEQFTVDAKLVLSAGGIHGTTTSANYTIVEEDEYGENMYECIGTNVALKGKLYPP